MNWEGQQNSRNYGAGGHNGMNRGTGGRGLNPQPPPIRTLAIAEKKINAVIAVKKKLHGSSSISLANASLKNAPFSEYF